MSRPHRVGRSSNPTPELEACSLALIIDRSIDFSGCCPSVFLQGGIWVKGRRHLRWPWGGRRKAGSLNSSPVIRILPGTCRRLAGQSISRDVQSPEAHFIWCHLFCVFNKLLNFRTVFNLQNYYEDSTGSSHRLHTSFPVINILVWYICHD